MVVKDGEFRAGLGLGQRKINIRGLGIFWIQERKRARSFARPVKLSLQQNRMGPLTQNAILRSKTWGTGLETVKNFNFYVERCVECRVNGRDAALQRHEFDGCSEHKKKTTIPIIPQCISHAPQSISCWGDCRRAAHLSYQNPGETNRNSLIYRIPKGERQGKVWFMYGKKKASKRKKESIRLMHVICLIWVVCAD